MEPATELTLAPGESKAYGLRFATADSIRGIDKTLADNGRPVAVGIPGYVLPMDLEAQLFLKHVQPVKSVFVEPKGAVAIHPAAAALAGWKHYTI